MSMSLVETSAAVLRNSPPPGDGFGDDGRASHYTPGHRGRKLLMIMAGVMLISIGVWQMWPSLRLLVTGRRVTAEAIDVVKHKAGLQDVVLRDDAAIQKANESRDRTYLFINRFRFITQNGELIVVELPTRSQLKPLFPLADASGLPTAVPVFYDPQDPKRVVFPTVSGTWFIPGMLTMLGLVCSVIGSILWCRAMEPIPLPFMTTTPAGSTTDPSEPIGA